MRARPSTAALRCYFPAPHSVTGEDVAELHVHGSRAVIAALFDALARLGLRLAEPGEFTRRAFLNHKLDLAEAEGLADLVAAETAMQRRQALRQLGGALGRMTEGWRARLLAAQARLEAAIDFPGGRFAAAIDRRGARARRPRWRREIAAHLADGHRGERLRDGLAVAILGPPNAGKSSLMNALARREVAITSAKAGTTRDVIEVALDLAGYPVLLADTAGLRESRDEVEEEGVRRARARAASADLKLVLIDATRRAMPVRWPISSTPTPSSSPTRSICCRRARRRRAACGISVKTGAGMEALLARLGEEVDGALAARRGAARHPRAPSRGARGLPRGAACGSATAAAARARAPRICAPPRARSAASPGGSMSRTCSTGCSRNSASANRTKQEHLPRPPQHLVAVAGTSRGRLRLARLYLVLLGCQPIE